ncbi:homeobox-leucine zipper protein HDG2-like [Andrographis paniculata]|uniref:homeobox-leucine zipper protein HDG2-like n=1 Tax=Andrographis paniculata TaxID=175694 RepID=UPI0021E72A33|nr:homeobox-leucine zipper protein HDG2-like [Andrographis paniculata]
MSQRELIDLNSTAAEEREELQMALTEERELQRKQYHRCTPEQTKELEEFFAECPRPSKKQRAELGQNLGMESSQVKFWFQNKLTQTKIHQEREENARLHAENNMLQHQLLNYKEVLENPCCNACRMKKRLANATPEARNLILENDRLKRELEQMAEVIAKYVGKPVPNVAASSSARLPSKFNK